MRERRILDSQILHCLQNTSAKVQCIYILFVCVSDFFSFSSLLFLHGDRGL